MIFDLPLYYSQLGEELDWQQQDKCAQAAQMEARSPVFRNIDYPLALTPLVVKREWDQQHQKNVMKYLQVLEKTIGLCAQHPAMSAYLEHSEMDRAFIRTPLKQERYITICRFDGYVDRCSGALKLLEHNTDSPAGILFTPRLNALVRSAWKALGSGALEERIASRQFDQPSQTQALFASFASRGAEAEMVILQEQDKSNVESREMALAFSEAGLPTRVFDPRQIDFDGTHVRAAGRRIDVIWNKINTVYWQNYLKHFPEQAQKWQQIFAQADVCHLNHFGARLVTENKRCLSLLQERQFAHLFSDEEHQLIRQMLPWASKFEPGKTVQWQGRDLDIGTLALEQRHNFVIKEPYDVRGEGVTVGLDCTATQWAQKVEGALGKGFILQEYIAPLQLPVFNDQHWSLVRQCNLSLDTFVFDGQVVGYGAKASTKHRVNLFKGGQKISVLTSAL
ncbi:glutathionylspermidine synthase family protein [Pseudomonas fluorescens]|uniref:glutathionylspermidine synthase family protein n=1 Tax=Pseudomonas fluorescens TaxID=294 RepID=UPI001241D725|nr:glutathionylspermidine synthase family protein [Pseudomonas fluorescens]VVM92399.1 hypothetical protein PS639_02848 [Pseudomonas fluorescens]